MSRRAAKVVIAMRFVLAPLWIALALFAYLYLPSIGQAAGGALGTQLLPEDAAAVRAELLSKKNFPFPLITRTLVVAHNEDGLPSRALLEAAQTARAVRKGRFDDLRDLVAVAPVPNAVFRPQDRLTTILYYLYFRPGVSLFEARDLANRFARQHVAPQEAQAFVGVTGTGPATAARDNIILDHLRIMTLATGALVAFAVSLFFRSLVAPVVNLATVVISYSVSTGVLGWLSQRLGLAIPHEVEPVVVVLLFGVVTDYSIFFLSRFRVRLREGLSGRDAAERGVADVTGIVLIAGFIVALATGSLIAAKLKIFQLFGPAMAISVLIGALVAVTFVPATLAILGRFALWPHFRSEREENEEATGEEGDECSLRARVARLVVRHPLVTAIACFLLLGTAASGLFRYEMANPILQDLPASAEPQHAYTATTGSLPTGVVAPTVAVVRGTNLARQQNHLRRLKPLFASQPGVETVLGPGDVPEVAKGTVKHAFIARNGEFARYLIILEGDPLDERPIDTVKRLRERAPVLLEEAGLDNAELSFGGDTAIAASLVERTIQDIVRVAPIALVVTFLALALFLRSLVAPIYLLAASALALFAALGLSAYLYEPLFDPNAISFFVPFSVSILLLALGSDYNVFIVGRVWDQAQQRPLREAVAVAGTRAARPIGTAGLILAASFGLLAIVPLMTFRVVALTMSLGLLLDAFVVRQLLVPALIVLVGRRGRWPGGKQDR